MPARFSWYNIYNLLLALLIMLSTCVLQVKSLEIVTPRMPMIYTKINNHFFTFVHI